MSINEVDCSFPESDLMRLSPETHRAKTTTPEDRGIVPYQLVNPIVILSDLSLEWFQGVKAFGRLLRV